MENPLKKIVYFVALVTLLTASFSHAEDSLDAALVDLSQYQFGESRLSQTVISAAVREANSDPAKASELAIKLSAILNEAVSDEAKRHICRFLGELGSPSAVPALATQLNNEGMGDVAVWALRQIKTLESSTALINALDTTQALRRLAVIEALGDMREGDVIRALVGVINFSSDKFEIETALNALAKHPVMNAGTAFVSIGTRISPENTDIFLTAVLENAHLLYQSDLVDVARRLYDDAYNNPAANTTQKCGALYGLVKCSPGTSTQLLVDTIQDKDPELSRTAAKCIRILADPETLNVFSEAIKDVNVETQLQILQALTDRGEKVGPLALSLAKETKDEALRLSAVEALGKAGEADSLEYLIGLAESGTTEQSRAARVALASLPADVDTQLLEGIGGADEKKAELLLRTLVERKAESVAPQLLTMVHSENEAKREAVLKALEALATPEQFPDLLSLLKDIDTIAPDSRRGVEKVLVSLGQKLEVFSPELIALCKDAGDNACQLSALKVIAGIGQMNAEPAYRLALEEAISGDDEDVSSLAVSALGEWPDREALPVLLATVEKAESGKDKDALYDAILSLVAKSQTLVAPPEGSNYELLHMNRVSPAPKPMGPKEAMAIIETVANGTVNEGLRKKCLSTLAKVPLPEALTLAQSWAKRPDLRVEAHTAMLSLSRYLMGANRDAAVEALNEIVTESENELLKSQAQALLDKVPALGDYLLAWRVSGPYAVGEGQDSVSFTDILPTTMPDAQPFVMDLLGTLGGFVRRAYVTTELKSESPKEVILELGSDDGVTVWLNGEVAHEFLEGRELIPGDDKIPLKLLTGSNYLKIVVHQKASYWHLCARLADEDGNSVEGVEVVLPEVGEY